MYLFDFALICNVFDLQDYIAEVAIKYVKEAKCQENSLINAYQVNNELDSKDIVTLVCDFLLAGIDTSANSMAFLLFELSKSLKVQQDLEKYDKINNITEETLKSFKLGKAIIKESLRLHPISVGVGRNLEKDANFSGYHIPAGSMVVTQNQVSSRLEKYCPYKPNDFWPYRHLDINQR